MLTPARRLTAPAAGAALLQTLRRTAALSPSEATAALLSTCRRTRQPQSQRVAVAFFTERGARRRISIPKLPQELAMLWSGFTARRFGRRGSASLSCSLRAERTPPLCPRLPFRPAQILTHSLTAMRAGGDNSQTSRALLWHQAYAAARCFSLAPRSYSSQVDLDRRNAPAHDSGRTRVGPYHTAARMLMAEYQLLMCGKEVAHSFKSS